MDWLKPSTYHSSCGMPGLLYDTQTTTNPVLPSRWRKTQHPSSWCLLTSLNLYINMFPNQAGVNWPLSTCISTCPQTTRPHPLSSLQGQSSPLSYLQVSMTLFCFSGLSSCSSLLEPISDAKGQISSVLSIGNSIKRRLLPPKHMNFQKSPKQSLTPLIFVIICSNFFSQFHANKALSQGPKSAT